MSYPIRLPHLMHYLDFLTPERPPELWAMEQYAAETEFPIIGPACGQFCYLIARLAGARQIFEMGSGYGYSTAWFARAVQENGGGLVFHTVWHEALSQQAQRHLSALGFAEIVRYQVGEAVAALRQAEGPFDLIFMDIDKEGYLDAIPVVSEKLRPGGVFLADNLLWRGQIFNGVDHSKRTEIMRQFTLRMMRDPSWSASIIPIRDGLLLAHKR